jgi:hypothetical protein
VILFDNKKKIKWEQDNLIDKKILKLSIEEIKYWKIKLKNNNFKKGQTNPTWVHSSNLPNSRLGRETKITPYKANWINYEAQFLNQHDVEEWNIKKYYFKKKIKSTRVNLPNSRPMTWDQDNPIKRKAKSNDNKVQSPINLYIEG